MPDKRVSNKRVSNKDEYRTQVRQWLNDNATPREPAGMWDTHVITDPEVARARFERGRAWQKRLFDAGYAGIAWPAEFGGQGGEGWMTGIFAAESGNYVEDSGFIRSTIAMLGPTLLRHGSDEQKLRFIPGLLSGDYAFCQLFSEPGAGSDLAGLAATAVLDGDEFIVNGQKVWNSSAQYANWGFLLVRTDVDVPKHAGISFLLIDMDSPGIEVRPLVQMNGAIEFNEVFLNDVRVPADQLVGELHGGWAVARTVLGNESAFIGRGGGPSTSERLIELAGLTGCGDDETVRQELATIWTREKLLKLMGQSIAQAVRKGLPPPMDGALIKLYMNQTKVLSGDLATRMMGPAAVTSETKLQTWVQNELIGRYMTSIGGGTNEVQRSNLAERALGLPRDVRVDKEIPWRDVPRS